ncbi:hypothetical protein [Streptomyces sp. MMS24-I29]|uniref:hypothetical protein n=1 Tax=Streptomyces sp. MMS24-I29 TaxID=3351480 RepID=UPI003C7D6533
MLVELVRRPDAEVHLLTEVVPDEHLVDLLGQQRRAILAGEQQLADLLVERKERPRPAQGLSGVVLGELFQTEVDADRVVGEHAGQPLPGSDGSSADPFRSTRDA